MDLSFQLLKEAASQQGFNLIGSVSAELLDAQAPLHHRWSSIWSEVKTVILLGTGGAAFWNSLDSHERRAKNMIDRASVKRTRQFLNHLKCDREQTQVVFPFRSSGRNLSFTKLAEVCGFGTTQTVLGYLLHPEFGPWVSLRAAVLCSFEVQASHPISGSFHPCEACQKPCISACPAMAISRTEFDFRACGTQLKSSKSCDRVCLARKACVVGPEHAYGDEESLHRQSFFKHSLLASIAV